jgi:hypothetical protein
MAFFDAANRTTLPLKDLWSWLSDAANKDIHWAKDIYGVLEIRSTRFNGLWLR